MVLFRVLVCLLTAHFVAASPSVVRHHDIAVRMTLLNNVVPVQQAIPVHEEDMGVVGRKRSFSGRCQRPSNGSAPVAATVTMTEIQSNTEAGTGQPAQASSFSGNEDTVGLPSYMTGTQYGDGTYYNTGLTACGRQNNDEELIAAVSHLLFDSFPGYKGVNPNSNPICGRRIKASYKENTVVVTITDRCTACALKDLDFTPTAMSKLDPDYLSNGRIHNVSWVWVD